MLSGTVELESQVFYSSCECRLVLETIYCSASLISIYQHFKKNEAYITTLLRIVPIKNQQNKNYPREIAELVPSRVSCPRRSYAIGSTPTNSELVRATNRGTITIRKDNFSKFHP